MEIVTSWMEQGELKIIKRLINRKIGEIAPQLLEKISQLPSNKLGDLSDALLDFSTEENLVAWLQENAEDSTEEESKGN